MSDQDALAYNVVDNRLVDLSSWRMPELKAAMAELDNGQFDMEFTGFDADAIAELFPLEDGAFEPSKEEKAAQPKTQIRAGDTILLGDHLLQVSSLSTPDELDKVADLVSHWLAGGGQKPKVLRAGKGVDFDF